MEGFGKAEYSITHTIKEKEEEMQSREDKIICRMLPNRNRAQGEETNALPGDKARQPRALVARERQAPN